MRVHKEVEEMKDFFKYVATMVGSVALLAIFIKGLGFDLVAWLPVIAMMSICLAALLVRKMVIDQDRKVYKEGFLCQLGEL